MSTERRCDGSEPSLRIIHLTNVSSTAGPYFAEEHVGRGAAFRDFDNDSDWDAVVVNNDEPAVLLRKDTEKTEHWVQLDLHGGRMQPRCDRHTDTDHERRLPSRHGTYARAEANLSDHDRRVLIGPASGD